MKRIVYGQNHKFLYWAEDVIGQEFRSDAETIGMEDGSGNVLASVVFDDFSKCGCNIHIASNGTRHWMTREYIVRAFAYPFIQCDFRRVTGLVASRNKDSLDLCLKLGFQVEGIMRDALPDDDIILMGMTRNVGLGIIAKYGKGASYGRR